MFLFFDDDEVADREDALVGHVDHAVFALHLRGRFAVRIRLYDEVLYLAGHLVDVYVNKPAEVLAVIGHNLLP